MLTDALTSLSVVILGIIWMFKPWYWLDPVFSWVIVLLILYSGWGILKEAYVILMNATPPGIDLHAIQESIESLEGVRGILHLHVWNISSQDVTLVAHIVVPDQMLSRINSLASEIRHLLSTRFAIGHPVLQFETEECEAAGLLGCLINADSRQMEYNLRDLDGDMCNST